MASPQTENGYTKFANELMEAFIRTRIPGQEMRVVLAIARKTYGFGKVKDQISYGQIAQMTEIPRVKVIMHVKSLVSKMVLGSLNNGTRKPPTLWINKDYEIWVPSPKKGTSPNYGTIPSPNHGTKSSPNHGTHKRKKEIERNIYSFLLCAWNSLKVIQHRKLTPKDETALRTTLKNFDIEDVLNAFELYSKVLKSVDHYWTHKWTLRDFLNRGFDKFLPEADPLNNFLTGKKEGPVSPAHKILRRDDD